MSFCYYPYMRDFGSRAVALFFLFVLLVSFLAELGSATGLIPQDVLDGLARHSAGWWKAPRWFHAAQALLLLTVIVWSSMLELAPKVSRSRRWIGCIAGAALSSHLSPVYCIAPFVPPVGTAVSLLLLGGFLLEAHLGLDPRPALLRALPRNSADRLLWGCIALAIVYCFVNQFGEASRVMTQKTDFGTFYEAASGLAAGGDPYRATGESFIYPPTFAFYFQSLLWLPKAGASLLWFALKLVLVIWALAGVVSLLVGPDMRGNRRRWFIAGTIFVAARFLFADLQFGNVNSVVLWLGLIAVALDFERRSVVAGLALAGGISVKIAPAVFLVYFAARGRIRVVLWSMLWIFVLSALPFGFAPHLLGDSWTSYIAVGVRSKLEGSLAQPDNQSLWGALNRSLDLSPSLIRAVWLECSLLLGCVAAVVAFRNRHEASNRQIGAASLFFLLGLLVSPGSWVVHYVAVLLPMAYLLHEAMSARRRAWVLWTIFAAANLVFTASGWTRMTVRLSIEESWFVAADCLLFFAVMLLAAGGPPARGEGAARGPVAGIGPPPHHSLNVFRACRAATGRGSTNGESARARGGPSFRCAFPGSASP
jgi:hypothetical protein